MLNTDKLPRKKPTHPDQASAMEVTLHHVMEVTLLHVIYMQGQKYNITNIIRPLLDLIIKILVFALLNHKCLC